MEDRIIVYTDGACIGNKNVKNSSCPTGWAAAVLRASSGGGRPVVFAELYGAVVLDSSSKYFLGATVGSNNTAELTAIGEALIWLHDFFSTDSDALSGRVSRRVLLKYDSEYAAKSVMGIFNGAKNKELIKTIREHYQKLQRLLCRHGGSGIEFEHVRGHSGEEWNDRVDNLARQAAAGATCAVGRYAFLNENTKKRTASAATVDEYNHGTNGSYESVPVHICSVGQSVSLKRCSSSVCHGQCTFYVLKRHPTTNISLSQSVRGALRGCGSDSLFLDKRNGDTAFEVVMQMPYSREVVDAIKAYVPGRRYLPTEKSWRAPLASLCHAVDLWEALGGRVESGARSAYTHSVACSACITAYDIAVRVCRVSAPTDAAYLAFVYDSSVVDIVKNTPEGERRWIDEDKMWAINIDRLYALLDAGSLARLGFTVPLELLQHLQRVMST